MTSSHVGIDKLEFSIKDYEISDLSHFDKTPATILKSGELTSQILVNGEAFGYLKNRDFEVMKGKVFVGVNSSGMKVSLNPNKVKNGHNGLLISEKEIHQTIKHISDKLNDTCIRFNPDHAKITRLDLTRDISPKYNFISYKDSFNLMNVPRTSSRDYGSTFTFSNTQLKQMFYDKKEHLRITKQPYQITGNSLRSEMAFTSAKSVQRRVGITEMKYLKEIDIHELFRSKMKENIFRETKQSPIENGISLSAMDFLSSLYQQDKSRYYMNDFSRVISALSIVQSFGSIENFKGHLSTLEKETINRDGTRTIKKPNRMTIKRIIERLELDLQRHDSIIQQGTGHSPVQLKEELREKLLAPRLRLVA